MRRILRTQHALNQEIAIILNDAAHDEAAALVRQGKQAPTGEGLFDELTRRHHAALMGIKKQQDREAAKKVFDAEIRQQQKREKKG